MRVRYLLAAGELAGEVMLVRDQSLRARLDSSLEGRLKGE